MSVKLGDMQGVALATPFEPGEKFVKVRSPRPPLSSRYFQVRPLFSHIESLREAGAEDRACRSRLPLTRSSGPTPDVGQIRRPACSGVWSRRYPEDIHLCTVNTRSFKGPWHHFSEPVRFLSRMERRAKRCLACSMPR